MGDWLVEVRGRGLQDLLDPVRELRVVTHQDRAGPKVLHVVERLVADSAFHLIGIRHLAHHLPECVGLALAGVTGHGDMQPVRVLYGLRRHREDHAAGDNLIADMLLGKGPEHQRHRVAMFEHIEGCGLGVGRDIPRYRPRVGSVLLFGFCPGPVLPGGLLLLFPHLPLRCPVRLESLAEFLPSLSTPAAGGMLTAGEDCAIPELDSKGPVLVG